MNIDIILNDLELKEQIYNLIIPTTYSFSINSEKQLINFLIQYFDTKLTNFNNLDFSSFKIKIKNYSKNFIEEYLLKNLNFTINNSFKEKLEFLIYGMLLDGYCNGRDNLENSIITEIENLLIQTMPKNNNPSNEEYCNSWIRQKALGYIAASYDIYKSNLSKVEIFQLIEIQRQANLWTDNFLKEEKE